MIRFRTQLLAVLSAFAFALPALPLQAFSPPEGPVILSVSGHPDVSGPVEFDRALLAALPEVSFVTETIWTEGRQEFTGVPLAALLDHLDVAPEALRLVAANEYAVELPVASLSDDAPILAYSQNGEPMSLRDRGPIWIVYPYDSDPSYRSEVIYSRSVWQLQRIEILP